MFKKYLIELSPEDIILNDGDVVVVQTRESEVYYTGGMIKGGQHPLLLPGHTEAGRFEQFLAGQLRVHIETTQAPTAQIHVA